MTHPLTDEKAINLFSWEQLMGESQPITVEDAMRIAADWQLDQVIQAWDQCYESFLMEEPRTNIQIIHRFEEKLIAMRSTNTQEDNS